MPRRLLSAAATGLLLLSLSACDDGGDGTVTAPPPSIDIEASSDGGGESDGGGDPKDAAPDIPAPDPADFAGMDENTPKGAEQAFRYYIAVSMWAHQTGDTAELEKLSGPDCGGCDYLNNDIADASNVDALWTETTVADVEIEAVESPSFDWEVVYNFTLSSHSRLDESGDSRVDVEALEYASVGGLDWESDKWVVSGMSIEWGDDVL